MNIRQSEAWGQLVRQCETQITERPYSSINVASQVRSDAIVAADELVELVTPKLAALLERLANDAEYVSTVDEPYRYMTTHDAVEARASAARIREGLALEVNE